MADYYLHKTAAHIDELLEKVEGIDNYDDTEVRGLINNKVDKVTGKGLSTNDFTDAYKETLDGLNTALDSKVDKETGKGLSTNDFTNAYKTELDGLDTALDGKVNKETGKGLSTNDYTTSEKTKLNGIESGANVNVQSDWNQTDDTADDFIKNKPNIPAGVVVDQVYDGTSTNAQSGVAIAGALSDKVDKVTGKGLSTNDYTTSEKTKLNGIESGANVNVQSDWSQTDTTADDYIKNKPNIPAGVVVDQVYDGTSTNAQSGVAIEAKKPGEITTGKQYTIGGQTVIAGTGAEAFNDLTNNEASGQYSHAEGRRTTASGNYSHAEGNSTTASGNVSHAEGVGTTAAGAYSHAEGSDTVAGGYYSHAEGCGTIASFDNQHVQGQYNVADSLGTYAFIIGNGTANDARHNAFAIDWNGLIYVNGVTTGVNVSQCITSTDYATQNTGGTIKAWTTTDGSDTILHLATQ